MRLWSIHPRYLDAKGLVALWREALLAQKVLKGETKGYRHHPQLVRFKSCSSPLAAISTYLKHVYEEADRRGYEFDSNKIGKRRMRSRIPVTRGQIDYELCHFVKKLEQREPDRLKDVESLTKPKSHPLFMIKKGPVENWEKLSAISKLR